MAALYCLACASNRVHVVGSSLDNRFPMVACRECGARGVAALSLELAVEAIAARKRARDERTAARRAVRR
jgi:hypothetical protein